MHRFAPFIIALHILTEIKLVPLYVLYIGTLPFLSSLLAKMKYIGIKKVNIFLLLFFGVIANSIFIRESMQLGVMYALIISFYFVNFREEIVQSKFWELLFYSYFFYVVFRASAVILPDFVFSNKSRNYISFYSLILSVSAIVSRIERKKGIVLISVLNMVLSFYAIGRNGIFTSVLLLLLAVQYSLRKKSKALKWSFLVFLILGLIMSWSYYLIYMEEFDTGARVERYSSMGFFQDDGGRTTIWSSYVDEIGIIEFLFGVDADVIFLPTNKAWVYQHLHSSLLNLHSVLGISSIFLLVYFLINASRRSSFHLFLLILILFRSSTDIGLFFTTLDFLLWILVI